MLAHASTAAPRRRRGPRRPGRPDRSAAAGAVVGERGQGRRPALLRPGAGRGGGGAGAPLGHRAPRSTSTGSTGPTPDLVDVDVTVACTAGTYIRAIARDAGAALGVGGHLTALRRTASGPFDDRRGRGPSRRPGPRSPPAGDRGCCGSTDAARPVFPARGLTAEEATRARLRPAHPGDRRPGLHAAVAPDGRLVALVEDAGADRPGRGRLPAVVSNLPA